MRIAFLAMFAIFGANLVNHTVTVATEMQTKKVQQMYQLMSLDETHKQH